MISLQAPWDGGSILTIMVILLVALALCAMLMFAFDVTRRQRAARRMRWLLALAVAGVAATLLVAVGQSVGTTVVRQQNLVEQAQTKYGVVLDSNQASELMNGQAIVLKNGDQIALKLVDDTHAKLVHIEPKNF